MPGGTTSPPGGHALDPREGKHVLLAFAVPAVEVPFGGYLPAVGDVVAEQVLDLPFPVPAGPGQPGSHHGLRTLPTDQRLRLLQATQQVGVVHRRPYHDPRPGPGSIPQPAPLGLWLTGGGPRWPRSH